MKYTSGSFVYEGKAKKVFITEEDPDICFVEFKDSLTAFNAKKEGSFARKGEVNSKISSYSFRFLHSRGFKTHFIEGGEGNIMFCKKLDIIPLEVVVRNVLAGSTASRLGIKIGKVSEFPILEFYYKSDDLEDPFINEDHILFLDILKREEIEKVKRMALEVNESLKHFFSFCGITLVDFKLEFGLDEKEVLYVADEISPDTCRLWENPTNKILDKDRFRNDLGDVKKNYELVLSKIEEKWGNLL